MIQRSVLLFYGNFQSKTLFCFNQSIFETEVWNTDVILLFTMKLHTLHQARQMSRCTVILHCVCVCVCMCICGCCCTRGTDVSMKPHYCCCKHGVAKVEGLCVCVWGGIYMCYYGSSLLPLCCSPHPSTSLSRACKNQHTLTCRQSPNKGAGGVDVQIISLFFDYLST